MKSRTGWIFFAGQAKPTSMRRAIPERLGAGEAVIIVEQPLSVLRERRVSTLRNRTARIGEHGTALRYTPLHFPHLFPGIAQRLNDWLLRREIDLLFPSEFARVVCYDSPTQYRLAKMMKECLSIYLAVDDLTVDVTGKPIRGELYAEQKMLALADLVVCVSHELAETLRSRAPLSTRASIRVLQNGYDERIFAPGIQYDEPEGLRSVSRPRILMTGHVSERIDWEGIKAAASLRQEWNWVFVGPADPGMQEQIHHILGERGFWHPPVPVRDIPGWIAHCDACAVAYRLNNFTRASYPLKLIEYLSMGAPTLSTRVPALQRYCSVIEWVDEADGRSYVSALDRIRAAKENVLSRSIRELAVAADSYAARTDSFKEIVSAALSSVYPALHTHTTKDDSIDASSKQLARKG